MAVERKTFCGICEATCGLTVTVEDGAVTKIRPDADHPHSKGFACPKGIAFGAVRDDPDRVTFPLRRLDDGSFERVSWEAALDDVGARLRAIARAHGHGSIGVAWGNPVAWNAGATLVALGLATALGTKHVYNSGSIDINNYFLIGHLLYGNNWSNPLPDFEHTSFALIVGANPLVSHGSMVTTGRIRDVLRAIPQRGGRVVVVDPRRTETAEQFEHVPIRPDSDAWLLGAMLNVIFSEGLEDDAALAEQVAGLEALRSIAAKFTVERAAAETRIEADTIRRLARDLASATSAAVYARCGTSLSRHSSLAKYFLDALGIVTGNFDRRGGTVFGSAYLDMERVVKLARLTGYDRWRSRVDDFPEVFGAAPMACMAREITTPGEGQMRALITCSTNPVTTVPGTNDLDAALPALELFVSLDPYITETNRHADYILPPTTWLEREGFPYFTQAHATQPHAQWVPAVVPPRGETRDDWWILDQIALRLGVLPSPVPGAKLLGRLRRRLLPGKPLPIWRAYDLLVRLGPYGDRFGLRRSGISRRRLLATDGAIALADALPVGVRRKRLHTKDKRVQLDHDVLRAEAEHLLDRQDDPAFPLRVISIRRLRSHNSWLHNVPKLMAGDVLPALLVNPVDAEATGVADGGHAKIASAWGELTIRVKVTDEMAPGAVGLPHGWGHRGSWKLAVGAGGTSYNVLTPADADQLDASGNAWLNGIAVALTPAGADDVPAPARPLALTN
jgi:formate dehydrogenase